MSLSDSRQRLPEYRVVPAAGPKAEAASPTAVLVSPIEFERRLAAEMRRAERCGTTLCVVVSAGTPALQSLLLDAKAVAMRLKNVPVEVIVSRLAEEETAMLLPDCTKADAIRAVHAAAPQAALARMATTHCYPDDLVACIVGDRDASQLPFAAVGAEQERRNSAAKRGIDIAVALTGLVACAPVMLAAAFAVAATSPGPVIFRQVRIGRYGRRFVLYKFRSMRHDADDRIHREHVARIINAGSTSVRERSQKAFWKQLDDDPRVTPVGRVLRRLKIDELPQLFNVLKGDLSVVGPRPALGYEVALYKPWHLRRLLQVKPGITGFWQITGDSHTTFDDMVRMDLHYIDRWSNRLDLQILLATVTLLLRRICEQFTERRQTDRSATTAPAAGAASPSVREPLELDPRPHLR